MKLLLDHNVSHKLVARLADLFPGSTQTRLLNLGRANDSQLWRIARDNDFVLVTKDRDVAELAVLRGGPPKVIWLRVGNCKNDIVERVIRANLVAIEELVHNSDRTVLELFG